MNYSSGSKKVIRMPTWLEMWQDLCHVSSPWLRAFVLLWLDMWQVPDAFPQHDSGLDAAMTRNVAGSLLHFFNMTRGLRAGNVAECLTYFFSITRGPNNVTRNVAGSLTHFLSMTRGPSWHNYKCGGISDLFLQNDWGSSCCIAWYMAGSLTHLLW